MPQSSYINNTVLAFAGSDTLRPIAERWTQRGPAVKAVCPDAANAFFIAAISKRFHSPALVIAPNPDYATRMADQLEPWLNADTDSQVVLFPEAESVPLERYEPDRNATQARIAALQQILQPPANVSRSIIVTSIQALSQRTIDRDAWQAAYDTVETAQQLDINATARRWSNAGYTMENTVDYPGAMSRRGGIIDIFPIGADAPVRIELFYDEVESIRTFDPTTQRSTAVIERAIIPPASETLPKHADLNLIQSLTEQLNTDMLDVDDEEVERLHEELARLATGDLTNNLTFYDGFLKHGTLFDYLPADTISITCRPSVVREAAEGADRRLSQVNDMKVHRKEVPRNFPISHMSWNDCQYGIESTKRRVELNPFGVDADDLGDSHTLPATLILGAPDLHEFEGGADSSEDEPQREHRPVERIQDALASGVASVIAISRHTARLREMLIDAGMTSTFDDQTASNETPDVVIGHGFAPEGFALQMDDGTKLAVLTDRELFGITKIRARTRRRSIRKRTQLENLTPGTYVVHEDHGIARFLTVEPRERDPREHLVLEFAQGDKIYLPTEAIDRIQIYQGGGDQTPTLSRMHSQAWKTARKRAQRSVEIIAGELIELYARRTLAPGIAHQSDTPWQQNLEDSFPFVETEDQAAAVEAVRQDMESGKSMDRVICGDVGFGKTEVAVRAAFKAVQSGYQVAVLVPTTLLAQQHTQTFKDRLGPFPVNIETLSRFKSNKEQRDIVAKLADGKIDIVIGTHRLIQRDVKFKNLGLAVIDEEQKFGVQHKEHLKQLRTQVDVLTLSATPIPRTLYLSLAGIRDMSNIGTPPEERRPVRTSVSERSDEIIRNAILRELDRGGQVFFLHNRVKSIERIHRNLMNLVPQATYAVGHGQMHEGELEDVMAAFDRHEEDVLICTTIIEAGIDMPNVNTLIVDDSDKFGLAQLHHLRGRVGRSARQAFAYFLVQPHKSLTEEADARLNTILAASDLGAGYQVATRDLEIRGMGNVIGAEQSGHVAAIGLHMYTKLPAQAVDRLKAIRTEQAGQDNAATDAQEDDTTDIFDEPIRTEVYLNLDDRIPNTYIEDLAQRLAVYQRIAWARSFDDLDEIREDLRDRYGPVPQNFTYTVAGARIRLLARDAGVDSVRVNGDKVTLALPNSIGDASSMLRRMLGPNATVGDKKVTFTIDQEDDPEVWIDEIEANLELVRRFTERILALLAA